jgi:hypothetical protein
MERMIRLLRVNGIVLITLAVALVVALGALAVIIFQAIGYGFAQVNLALVALIYAFVLGRSARRSFSIIKVMQRAQDERLMPAVPTQPPADRALPPGTRVTLGYTIQPGQVAGPLLRAFVQLVLFTVIIEILLAPFYPDILPLWHLLGNAILGLPIWVQWAVFGVPLALSAYTLAQTVRQGVRRSQHSITIDDTGIEARGRFGRARHIAWGDIRGLVRMSVMTGDQALGPFVVYGPQHYVELNFQPSETRLGLRGLNTVRLSLPLAEYRALAEQIIATVCMRSHVALRGITNAYYHRAGSRLVNTFALTAQDVAAMPAPVTWQPAEDVLVQARAIQGPYTIVAEANILQAGTLRSSSGVVRALWFPIILSIGAFLILTGIGPNDGRTFSLKILAAVALFALLFSLISVPSIRQRHIRITADAEGLHRRGLGNIDIPWASIQAWGMIPPGGKRPFPTYVVLWAGPTLSWSEPVFLDPAYQAAANWLHAIIAARTGLPLHQIVQG